MQPHNSQQLTWLSRDLDEQPERDHGWVRVRQFLEYVAWGTRASARSIKQHLPKFTVERVFLGVLCAHHAHLRVPSADAANRSGARRAVDDSQCLDARWPRGECCCDSRTETVKCGRRTTSLA